MSDNMYAPGVSPPSRNDSSYYSGNRAARNAPLRRGSEDEHDGGGKSWKPRPPSMARVSNWLHHPRPPSKNRLMNRAEDSTSGTRQPIQPYRDLEPEMDLEDDGKLKKYNIGTGGRKQYTRVKKQLLEKHACERAIMCFLAVALLWMTSLSVAQAIVGAFIKSPKLEAVVARVNSAIAFTNEQQQEYVRCAIRKAGDCNSTFTDEVEEARIQVRLAEERNYNLLVEHNATALACRSYTSKAAELLNLLTRSNPDPLNIDEYDLNSNSANCTLVREIVNGNAGENAILTFNIANDYAARSDSTFNSLASSANARAQYDLNYANQRAGGYLNVSGGLDSLKTAPEQVKTLLETKVEEYKRCLLPNPPANSVCSSSIVDQIVSAQAAANSAKATFTNLYEKFKTDYAAFVDSVQGGTNIEIPAVPVFPPIPGVDSAAIEQSILNYANQILEPAVNEAGEVATEAKDATEAAQATLQQGFFDDPNYNPPPAVPPETVSEWKYLQETFLTEITAALKTTRSDETDEEPEFASTAASEAAAGNLLAAIDPREWDFYSYTPEVFEAILDGLQAMSDVFVQFDVAYRVIRSLQLIHKYWNISAVSTPPADLRVNPAKKGQVSPSFQRSPVQKMAYMLSNPLVNLAMIFVFFMVLVGGFYYLYSPIFNEYSNNCVGASWETVGKDDGKVSNGTMLYRNVYTIAYQYASSEGDKTVAQNVDKLNVGRDLICRDETTRSDRVATRYEEVYQALSSYLKQGVANQNALLHCLDLNSIDGDYATRYPLLGSEIASLSQYLNDFDLETCGKDLQKLEESRYDCSTVGKCTVQCDGVSEERLKEQSFDTACDAEWYLHGLVLGSFLSVLVYCLINLSRYMLLRAIVQVFWRHIASNRFQILVTVLENGEILYPERVTEDGEAFRDVIADELHTVLHKFTRYGVFILIGAMMVNVPWIIMLSFFSSNLGLQ